jgi:outer membrane protein
MKKLSLTVALSFAAASFAQADTVFGIYAGAGSWNGEYEGKAGDPSISLKELGVKDHSNNFYYIAIEHPIPVIPNIRLSQIDITSKQSATINRTFVIDGTPFLVGEKVDSQFDLSHTEAVLYYEVLDNWVNLDLGLAARKFDGYVSAQSATRSEKVKLDDTLPMLYVKAQFDLPFTGLSAGVEGTYVSYDDDKLSDYSAKISYLFDSALDFGLEAGYRKFSLEVDDDDLQGKVDIKGPYAAVIAHF